jgi:aspartate dehydrogenase
MRIGLIGLGAIGGAIVEAAAGSGATLVGAVVAASGRVRPPGSPPCVASIAELLDLGPEVVIECAGQAALRDMGCAVLDRGIDLVPASIGLFSQDDVLRRFRAAAAAGKARIRLPSGAVAGIDGLLAARRLALDTVRYRFVMSPGAWGHAVEPPKDGGTRTVVYAGSAREAATRYPKHANVTATIALAGTGFERTTVELVVDAQATHNRHEIEAAGSFGTLSIAVVGRRISESSPSSRLVAGSLLAAALSGAPLLA